MASFGEVLEGENKVNNGAKLCITCNTLTTFVILGPKRIATYQVS